MASPTIAGKILNSTLQLFSKRGYYDITVKEIANAASVTEGSVFRMFGSKQALLAQAIRCKIIGSSDPAYPPQSAREPGGYFDCYTVELAVSQEIENILSARR